MLPVARAVVAVSAYEYPPLLRLDLLADDKLLLTGVLDSNLVASFGIVTFAAGFGEDGDSSAAARVLDVTVNETKLTSSLSSSILESSLSLTSVSSVVNLGSSSSCAAIFDVLLEYSSFDFNSPDLISLVAGFYALL